MNFYEEGTTCLPSNIAVNSVHAPGVVIAYTCSKLTEPKNCTAWKRATQDRIDEITHSAVLTPGEKYDQLMGLYRLLGEIVHQMRIQ